MKQISGFIAASGFRPRGGPRYGSLPPSVTGTGSVPARSAVAGIMAVFVALPPPGAAGAGGDPSPSNVRPWDGRAASPSLQNPRPSRHLGSRRPVETKDFCPAPLCVDAHQPAELRAHVRPPLMWCGRKRGVWWPPAGPPESRSTGVCQRKTLAWLKVMMME